MNRLNLNLNRIVVLLFLSFAMISCSNDNEDNDPVSRGDYALSLAIQGTEGNFSYYTVPFEQIMEGTLTAQGQGIEQPGYYDFVGFDNTIYSLGGLDDVNVVAISQNPDGTLNQVGDVSFSNSLSDMVKAGDNTLVSVTMSSSSDIITFRKFNSNSITVTEEKVVQVSEFTNLVGPSYSGMVVRGDELFLSYYISDPNTYDTNYTDQAEVAVFSYPELEFQKVITDTRVGPIGGFNVKSGLVKDNDGNVYAISHSNPANGFSQSTQPAGVLRINAGETEFDQNYYFDIVAASGGFNTAHLKFLGANKAFAEMNTATRDTQERWSDGPLQSAVIDFETQTVDFIQGVPEHKGNGRRLAALQEGDNIYLCIPEDNGIYVYEMDTRTLTATKGAKVQASFVAGFFKF
ncbi:DUF4374 domain-containing protein [Mesonia sp. K7]|uniref:DUF4374 domain-containing protein n=1 Tax=Mesonia sp. K7 TaxID=2218606 RepID=UPI000DA78920|nr:DUF4374 domain-containing protein [Mesonia sp. K7]PZD78964.1 hypothetical protein DNG35_02870 [Mesonia sp. K7]